MSIKWLRNITVNNNKWDMDFVNKFTFLRKTKVVI